MGGHFLRIPSLDHAGSTPWMRTLRASRDMSRRTVMRGALATAGIAAVDVPLGQSASAAGRPAVMARSTPHDARVVVVGAGLAGLTAAYRLARQGVHVQVFEARDDRVGGRCWTARGFAGGRLAEHGGERIDTRHTHIRKLADELGLRLEEDNPGRRHGERGVLSLQGAVRDQALVSKDMAWSGNGCGPTPGASAATSRTAPPAPPATSTSSPYATGSRPTCPGG